MMLLKGLINIPEICGGHRSVYSFLRLVGYGGSHYQSEFRWKKAERRFSYIYLLDKKVNRCLLGSSSKEQDQLILDQAKNF
jgi:hypothetical protein